ncbi:MAG: efflux RND transporter permease subunit [Pseudomonadales bacterium]|nr:efflux RND transporter permease subunit [Pseudomonadales bacterium]
MMAAILNNGRVLVLCIGLLFVSGFAALSTLPRAEDPYIVGRTAMIITKFPGASAKRVEALVTEKLENKLRELPELKTISSSSRQDLSFISLRLKAEVGKQQAEQVWSRARNLLDEVQHELPSGAQTSILDEKRNHAYTLLVGLSWNAASPLDMAILSRYSKELESQLRAVSGTQLVAIHGQPIEEVLVSVDAYQLASLGLSMADISKALQGADSKVSAGKIHNALQQISLEVSGEFTDLERIRQVPLRVDERGLLLQLGDIATVKKQERLPPTDMAIVNSQRGIVIGSQASADMRVDQWTEAVEKTLLIFEQNLPSNIKLARLFNQNDYTSQRLKELMENITLGFILIVLVLLVTLGWRSALVVASALPLTVCFTFTVMQYYGLAINQMTMTGLIVAMGIMVDNAIVMVDTIAHERKQGLNAKAAVKKALNHLWLPLLGSTLTTILAFMPIAIMPGSAGEFVGGIALAVIFSLIGSYIISHTLIAALAGRFIKVSPASNQNPRWWENGIRLPKLAAAFESSLHTALTRPKTTLLAVMGFSLFGFYGGSQLTEQFFPVSDRDMFNIEVYLPESASLQATESLTLELDKYLQKKPELTSLQWFIGASSPSYYYNLVPSKDGSPFYAQAMVTMTDFKAANAWVPQLQIELDARFPQAQIIVRKLEQGPPFNAPVEYRIVGPNLNTLKQLGDDFRLLMSDIPAVKHTRATLANATPKAQVNINENEAKRLGLTLRQISEQLHHALDGVVHSSLLETTEELPVRIRLGVAARDDLDSLLAMNIVSPQMTSTQGNNTQYSGIPLSTIADIRLLPSHSNIPRRNGERINTIEAYLRDGILPANVVKIIDAKLADGSFTLPVGYRLEKGGESEKRNDAVGDLMIYIGLIITLLVVVVVLSFNSFRLSGIIFAVAIQAAGLGLFSVYLFGYAFGFTVIIGLLGLIGLAINAAIVILAELKANPEAIRGDKTAITLCVTLCARHISSTTITTLGGFMPLILSGGGFWPPFAIAIAGGTLFTTLLSFYFVPAVFMLMAKRRAFELSTSH